MLHENALSGKSVSVGPHSEDYGIGKLQSVMKKEYMVTNEWTAK